MFQSQDAGMHSITIELLRTGTPHNQTLSPGITYLALCGSHPATEFRIDLEQYKFNQYLNLLRYKDKYDESRILAIEALQKIITDIFEKITALLVEANNALGWLHIRLVMTPKELSMLPFELALTPNGFQGMREKPFLLNQQRLTTLTREVRQVASKRYEWPAKVRILFAWAQPDRAVPHEQHFDKLSKALWPWAYPFKEIPSPVPNISPLLTVVENATLTKIREKLEEGINEDNPYTHVHILAHGTESQNEGGECFELALQGTEKATPVDGHQLASALIIVDGSTTYCPAIVTITACDSGNAGTPILRNGSLAHALHSSGIPCVFASQFPLSIEGSVKLVDCLYPRLIRGDDPRVSLYYSREALNDESVHDWASLVAYARLPEDIDEQLEEVRLKFMLESMEVANAYADHLLENKDKIEEAQRGEKFAEIEKLLDQSIQNLKLLLKQRSTQRVNPSLESEHYGLIGSANKRKSEYLFRTSSYDKKKEDEKRMQAVKALKEAQKWYKKGFEVMPSNHWNGGQLLTVTAVTKGTLASERKAWQIVKLMAEQDLKEANSRAWGLGSLAELYLLRPLTVPADQFDALRPQSVEKAKACLAKLTITEDAFAIKSTKRQFMRYINWWPELFPFEGVLRLKDMAMEILNDTLEP